MKSRRRRIKEFLNCTPLESQIWRKMKDFFFFNQRFLNICLNPKGIDEFHQNPNWEKMAICLLCWAWGTFENSSTTRPPTSNSKRKGTTEAFRDQYTTNDNNIHH